MICMNGRGSLKTQFFKKGFVILRDNNTPVHNLDWLFKISIVLNLYFNNDRRFNLLFDYLLKLTNHSFRFRNR